MADDKSSKGNRRKALGFAALTSVFFYTAGTAAVMLTPLKSNLIMMLVINLAFSLIIGLIAYLLFNKFKGKKAEKSK